MRSFGVLIAAVLCIGPAAANPFDECVLSDMKGVTSDLAAKSIKVACLRKSSVEIPSETLATVKATANYGDWGNGHGTGFMIHIDNQIEYVITEITVRIKVGSGPDRLIRTDDFTQPPPPGVIYTGLPPDPTVSMMIKPFSVNDYWIPMKTDIDLHSKTKPASPGYNWDLMTAKGIPVR
jgi:hypothetical protein